MAMQQPLLNEEETSTNDLSPQLPETTSSTLSNSEFDEEKIHENKNSEIEREKHVTFVDLDGKAEEEYLNKLDPRVIDPKQVCRNKKKKFSDK